MPKKKMKTIESMPESVKALYVKILVAQAYADGKCEPQEVSELYLLMAQLDLSAPARQEIREYLAGGEGQVPSLVDEIVSEVEEEDRQIVAFSILKDLVRISMIDGCYSGDERGNIEDAARRLYGEEYEEKLKFAEDVARGDKDFLQGGFKSYEQLMESGKKLTSGAAAVGVPVAALYFSGTAGFSAAGITSGLAALGFGGISALGFSSMVTGIGVVVLIGVGTFSVVHYGLNLPEKERAKKRESLIQEIIRLHQRAIAALSEDVNEIVGRQEKLAALSEKNKTLLEKLKGEIVILDAALDDLKSREQSIC